MTLILKDYWMGRDEKYPQFLTSEIIANAEEWLVKVNHLLALAYADGVEPSLDSSTDTHFASGWRPPIINERTSNAGKFSSHLTGEGGDLSDDRIARPLAIWCVQNKDTLKRLGLFMERPQWTPSWVHLQTRPPKSGRTIYVPSEKPPLAQLIPGEDE